MDVSTAASTGQIKSRPKENFRMIQTTWKLVKLVTDLVVNFGGHLWPWARRLHRSTLIMRLLFWCILGFTLITGGEHIAADRAIRALAFQKGSSFFYRMNYKINSLPYTTIFAQAAGFKVVWELPAGSGRVGRSISDVHEGAELVYESHGFDGRSCLLKNICHALEYVSQKEGVIAKILKLLVGSYINNETSKDTLYCDVHDGNCPLELIGIDSFMER